MPVLSFQNGEYEWVAVSLRWGLTTKNFTLAVGSNPEFVDTQGAPARYAWKPDNEVIDETEFGEYSIELNSDAEIYYGNPPEGRVPVIR
jgi:hypothetical protein